MKRQNRLEKWLFASVAIILVSTFLWITCTQKSPIDATSSLKEEIPLLTDMTAIPNQVALGGDQSEIQVKLMNQDGEPLSDEIITFTTNLGTVTNQDTTDADGWARTILTSGQQAGQAGTAAIKRVTSQMDQELGGRSVFAENRVFSPFVAEPGCGILKEGGAASLMKGRTL